MRLAHRGLDPAHRGLTIVTEHGVDWNGIVRPMPDRLQAPLSWTKPSRVFVDSMSDLFHPDVSFDFIARVFAVMAAARQHQFQVLTKRPKRMWSIVADVGGLVTFDELVHESFDDLGPDRGEWPGWPLPNVWLGTSIESERYTWRAEYVRETPAQIRFLSLEPLLEALPSLNLTLIDWVIAGGESGHGARPMHPDWVRAIRDDCIDVGVPFHLKQWGEYVMPDQAPPDCEGSGSFLADFMKVGTKAAGRLLDGRVWDEFPEPVPA